MTPARQHLAGHTFQMQHIRIQNEFSSYVVESSPSHPNKCYMSIKTKLGQVTSIDHQPWDLKLNTPSCTEAKVIRNRTQRRRKQEKHQQHWCINWILKWFIQETSMCQGLRKKKEGGDNIWNRFWKANTIFACRGERGKGIQQRNKHLPRHKGRK